MIQHSLFFIRAFNYFWTKINRINNVAKSCKRKIMSTCIVENEMNLKVRSPFLYDGRSDRVTAETLQKLLKKLERFEKSNLYLKNSISLFKLTAYCDSNVKYVSHVLNFHKEKDFNNYINELRIQYVLKKLHSDANYRKYKIAILAKESGFSSPNKFSFVFKNSKGVLPSTYIRNLE